MMRFAWAIAAVLAVGQAAPSMAQQKAPSAAAIKAMRAETDRRAKAGDFDATGEVTCQQNEGGRPGTCGAAVARGRAEGIATVVATFENGFARRLYFEGGAFVGANATMSGAGKDLDWRLEEGTHLLRIDDQTFEIPDTLLFGASEPATAAAEPAAAAAATTVAAAEPVDIDWGRRHYKKNCRGCHGPTGKGLSSYPKLAGLEAAYLTMRLEQYRAGEKIGPNTPLMAPRARKLSDADIANLVAHIGTFD